MTNLPPPPSLCLWVALKSLTTHTITQSLTLFNFSHKTSGEFKLSHNIGRVKLYKKIHNLFTICPSQVPWVALKNLTIHTITKSLKLSNFFHKTPGEFKFSHNIGKVEVYENKFSPLPVCPSCPWVALKNSQSLWPYPTFYTRHLASQNLAKPHVGH